MRLPSSAWRMLVLVGVGAWSACASDQDPESELPQEVPEGDEHGIFARDGIELVRVTIDQGVAITLFEDGAPVPLGDRNTRVVAGRPALLRGMWVVPDDWQAREIEARLRLHYPDGSSQEALRTLEIGADAVENWFDGAFSFYVPAELVSAELEWDMTLYEVGAPDGSLPPAVVPRLPAEGTDPLDPDLAPREIDVVIVPIDHDYDGGKTCPDEAPTFDAERLQGFADALYVQNPVQRVTVTAREQPLVWTESASKLGEILDELGKLRAQDGAPPWVYYYGAIEPCDWGSDEGFSGLAFVPKETTESEAWRRVSVGDIAVSETSTKETFVHEIGHNQERRHVPCGNPKGAVDDYPYRDGLTASYGFDVLRWTLHAPTNHDYMSYCGPAWNSDYGWNQVLPVQAELTSWKETGASWPSGPGFVIGAFYADGSEAFWTMPGTPSLDPGSTDVVEFFADDRRIGVGPLTIEERPDGTLELVAPLPDEFGSVTHLRLVSGAAARVVPREHIALHHLPTR